MPLVDVVDSIIADFTASSVTCPILYGPDHSYEHASPPRIVIVPTSDTYGPPLYVEQVGFPAGSMFDGQNPRPVQTRNEGARAEIWAAAAVQSNAHTQQRKDYDALNALINQFILSLHRVNPGNYTVQNGSTTETTRIVRRGYVYTLNFSIQTPITDTAWPTETGVTPQIAVQEIRPDGSIIKEVDIS